MKDNSVLDRAIRRVPDFPKPGILFYDVTSIFTNPQAFKFCLDCFEEKYRPLVEKGEITAVAGAESRGFLFAAPLADRLSIPLILFAKKENFQAKFTVSLKSLNTVLQKSKFIKAMLRLLTAFF